MRESPLCCDYACVVRRGGIAAAGVRDSTRYLALTLKQTELNKLIALRRSQPPLRILVIIDS